MEPLLVFPDPPPPALAQALDLGGYPWKAVGTAPTRPTRVEPEDGWAGAVVCADDDPEGAFALCRALRKRDLPLEPLLLVVGARPARRPRAARGPVRRLLPRARSGPASSRPGSSTCSGAPGRGTRPELVEYGAAACSTWRPTRPPSAAGPLDLTYMEYELLKFLATHPGKVFTRETLLSPGVGLRVLRRRPHGRRPHPAAAGQARRGARRR